MFISMQVYVLPILVLDEKKRVFTSYKKSMIMMFSAPFSTFLTVVLFLWLALIFYPLLTSILGGAKMTTPTALLTLFPVFLLPFITFTLVILMQLNAAFIIFEKHNVFEEKLDEVWEQRTISSLFKPWDAK